MQMAEQFDISTLAWVKGEIDETLKQARIALESYVEDPDEPEQLQACIDYIHQVAGTLQMVELLGAALFADEVEKFATALLNGKTEDPDQGYELLMRAILQLPDYLESLLGGKGDNPVALVPLLNDLRQLRGDDVLDTTQFFRPNLRVAPPPRKGAPAKGVTSQVAAKKLHRYYLPALAKLVKGAEVEHSLKTIATVIDKFNGVAEGDLLRRLLWVASAFVEALRDGTIELDKQSKPLLGRLEQQIKLVAAGDEEALDSAVVDKLLQAMLYRIAHSEAAGKHAAAVRLAFDLERFMPGSTPGLGGLNAELKQTVSADIMEELTHVKDSFDIFVRSDRNNTASLAPLADSLNNIAETLSLLQEESLRASLKEQVSVIRQLVNGETEADDDVLMGVAGAILAVESALRDWGSNAPVVEADARDEQVDDAENSPQVIAEHQRVTRQVMKEAKEDLIRVREAINNYLDKPEDKGGLDGLPGVLHTVSGSLTMLSYKRVAEILHSTRAFIEHELIESDTIPEQQKLDALADAVMSVEYYLEAFVQSRVHPGSVLDVAESAVEQIGYPIGSERPPAVVEEGDHPEAEGIEVFDGEPSAAEEHAPADETPTAAEETPTEQAEETPSEPTPSTEPAEEPSEEESDQGLAFGSAQQWSEAESEPAESGEPETVPDEAAQDEPPESLQAEAAEAPAAETPIPETPPEPEAAPEEPADSGLDIDDEILEIFIEEAEEELASINQTLPAWTRDTSDSESLKTLRRSFHTLKGSGRLVGASDVGEFAWAFENMLNKVIEGTVTPSATMFDLLDQAHEAIPELIEQFRSGTAPQTDVEMLRQMAHEIVEPGGLKMPETAQPSAPKAEPEP
ncbi:MAG: Hpt domain-containing protein, partial [Pseudomonadota bacterium]